MDSLVLARLEAVEERLAAVESTLDVLVADAAEPQVTPVVASTPVRATFQQPEPRPEPPPLRIREPVPRREIDWSAVFGARGLAVAGGVVTVLGIVFFFALAVNRGWIGPGARVALGAIASTIVFVAGLELRRRYGRLHAPVAAVGAGLAGGYATLYAATALYDLAPQSLALVFAAGIAATGLAVSLRWKEQLLAATGLLGAIVAPALLALDSELSATGTAFVAFMFTAAVIVSVAFRWRALLVAAAIVATPQALGLFVDQARPSIALLVLSAAFCGIYLGAGLAWQLRSESERILPLASSFIVGSAGFAFLPAGALFFESDRLYRGIDLLAFAAAYAAIGSALYVRKARDVASMVVALALALGAVGVADVLSGATVTYVWAAEAAALAWLARRLREPRFVFGAIAYLLLALGHAVVFEAPLSRLFTYSGNPAAGVWSVLAAALASVAVAVWATQPRYEREVKVAASALAAVLFAEAAALGVLGFYVRVWPGSSAFDHGHVAVTGLWALGGVAAVVAGLTRRRSTLATAGLLWIGVVLVKALRYDGQVLPGGLHAWSYLEVAAALLVVAVLVQVRRSKLWRDPTVSYLTVATSLALALAAVTELLDGRLRGAAWLGVAALYGALAAFFLRRADRDFATVLWSLAAAVAVGAEAQLLGGQWLVVVWSASAVVLALLVHRASERRFQLAAAFYLLLAFAGTFFVEATPIDLFSPSSRPAHGLPALAALTLATLIAARLSRPPAVPARDPVDTALDEMQPRVRSLGTWVAGAFAVYGLSLGILQVAEWTGPRDVKTNFQSGHTAVSAVWGALGLTLLYVGLRRGRPALRVGGLVLFGLSLSKLFLYDLARLSSITRALSFLAVGAVLLLGGFFYQRLGAHAEEGTVSA